MNLLGAGLLALNALLVPGESGEAARIAKDVLSNGSWLAEADRCPSKLMLQRESRDHLAGNDCTPGRLSGCLSKCSTGGGGSCYWLAYALQQSQADRRASEALFQRACKLGVMSGCTNRAAGMLAEKKDDSSAQACAAETFSRTCAFDDPWACTMYASLLNRGIGVAKNNALALKVLEKACKYGPEDQACIYGTQLKKEILRTDPGARKQVP